MNEEKMYWIIGSKRGREDVNENDKNDFEHERISVTKKLSGFRCCYSNKMIRRKAKTHTNEKKQKKNKFLKFLGFRI